MNFITLDDRNINASKEMSQALINAETQTTFNPEPIIFQSLPNFSTIKNH